METQSIRLKNSLLFLTLALLGLYLTSLHSYLLMHTVAEIFTIVISGGVFILAWNTRQMLDNNYLLFIGIGLLFVAALTLLHTLAYKGMGVFPKYDANLATQLWTAIIYLHSLTFMLAPFFIDRSFKISYVLGGYLLATGLVLLSIFYWRIFPVCYIEGQGLTEFKVVSEHIVGVIFLISIGLLIKHRQKFEPDILRVLILAILFNIGAEMAFTFYINVYGFSNLIGHFLRLISVYLIYKAIVETGLVKPHRLLFRDLKQSEETLRQQTAELQTRNQELDAFAHTVAHDLKNPVATIISASELLLEYDSALSDEEWQKTAEIIKQSGFKMSNLITDLLVMAEIRHADVLVKPLNMAAIVEEALNRLAYLFEAQQVDLILPEVWPTALGYAPWIEEVWVNYMSNAIKYGGTPPRLELGGAAQPEDGMACFWVVDNGPGLSPEAQAQLFSPFTRLEQTRAKGHGLGLSIVQRIVTKLGGQVGLNSEGIPGRGSRFYFTLPTKPGHQLPA